MFQHLNLLKQKQDSTPACANIWLRRTVKASWNITATDSGHWHLLLKKKDPDNDGAQQPPSTWSVLIPSLRNRLQSIRRTGRLQDHWTSSTVKHCSALNKWFVYHCWIVFLSSLIYCYYLAFMGCENQERGIWMHRFHFENLNKLNNLKPTVYSSFAMMCFSSWMCKEDWRCCVKMNSFGVKVRGLRFSHQKNFHCFLLIRWCWIKNRHHL